MDVLFELPSNAWDILPLPNVIGSNTNSYRVVFHFKFPTFLAQLFGLQDLTFDEQCPTRATETEPQLVKESRPLIESGNFALCEEGVGGTYFIKNLDDSNVAVFKPTDEEPGAQHDPKKIVHNPMLPPGGGSMREVAAYLLDRDHFAGVPETCFLSGVSNPNFASTNTKNGSLQRYVKSDDVSSSMGHSSFTVDDVQRIAILDIRIFNMDRNGENMLVRNENGRNRLIPIDHTYSLPPISSLDGAFFEWQYWPQAKQPLSPETLAYVEKIDIDNDANLLRSLGFPEESILTMIVTTTLLKQAVEDGWTLHDIACYISRGMPMTKPSQLEELIRQTTNDPAIGGSISSNNTQLFLKVFRQALKKELNTQSKDTLSN